jgi:hypothetical protein
MNPVHVLEHYVKNYVYDSISVLLLCLCAGTLCQELCLCCYGDLAVMFMCLDFCS